LPDILIVVNAQPGHNTYRLHPTYSSAWHYSTSRLGKTQIIHCMCAFTT